MPNNNSTNSRLLIDEDGMVAINFEAPKSPQMGVSRGLAMIIVSFVFGFGLLALITSIFLGASLSLALSDNDKLSNQNANLKLERDALRCEIEIYKTLHQEYANSGKVDDPNNYVCDNHALKKDGGE